MASSNTAIVVAAISMLGTVPNGASAWSNIEISRQRQEIGAVRQQVTAATLLSHVAGNESVVDLDKIGGANSSRADFIVPLADRGLIVECKSSLGSAEARTIVTADHAVELWERFAEAYGQCASTIAGAWHTRDPRTRGCTEFASFVLYEEPLVIEGGSFNALAKRLGLLDKIRLGRVEILSAFDFERLLIQLGPDRLFEAVRRKWDDDADLRTALLIYCDQKGLLDGPPAHNWEHLREAGEELLPGTRFGIWNL